MAVNFSIDLSVSVSGSLSLLSQAKEAEIAGLHSNVDQLREEKAKLKQELE